MGYMNLLKQLFACLLAISALSACRKDDDDTTTPFTWPEGYTGRIQYLVEANYNYDYFVQMQTNAAPWSMDTLRATGPWTLLSMNSSQLYSYGLWPANYAPDLMRYLIIPGRVELGKLPMGSNQPFTTLLGTTIYVSKYTNTKGDTLLAINGSKVTGKDAVATNGLIQTVEAVFPPAVYTSMYHRIISDTSLSMFAAALQRTGLEKEVDTGALTVLAPLNSAFTSANTASLGLGISTMDSLLQTDHAVLKRLVENHLIRGLHFSADMINDFEINNADTVRYATQSGDTIRYYRQYNYYDYWYGKGNTQPAQFKTQNSNTYQPLLNEVAGKSVLDRITEVLAF